MCLIFLSLHYEPIKRGFSKEWLKDIFSVHDLFFINFMKYCETILVYVKIKIREMNKDLMKETPDERKIQKSLKAIIMKHQTAIELVDGLDECLNFIMFVCFFGHTFIICFLVLQFSIVSMTNLEIGKWMLNFLFQLQQDIGLAMKLLVYAWNMLLILFLFSYYGTNMIEEVIHPNESIKLLKFQQISESLNSWRNFKFILVQQQIHKGETKFGIDFIESPEAFKIDRWRTIHDFIGKLCRANQNCRLLFHCSGNCFVLIQWISENYKTDNL